MIWSGQTTRIRRRVSVITKRPADFIHTVESACSAWLNKRFYSFVWHDPKVHVAHIDILRAPIDHMSRRLGPISSMHCLLHRHMWLHRT
jgi:hypothetical protein